MLLLRTLTSVLRSGRDFDVSLDGTRFVMMRANSPRTGNRMRVLLNWRRLLEDRLTRGSLERK